MIIAVATAIAGALG
ncbi:MAG: DUF6486 family protein, partial [Parabacteroides sp.]